MLLHCLYSEGQNNKLLILINNNNLPPSLAKFSPGDRKQGINKCWPNKQTSTKQYQKQGYKVLVLLPIARHESLYRKHSTVQQWICGPLQRDYMFL